jgi:hypothetical protein
MKQTPMALAVLLVAIFGSISTQSWAQKQDEGSGDEYRIYEAVLGLMDQMPKPDIRVTIFNQTLNTRCGDAAYPSPTVNGCTFLWVKPDDSKTVKNLLRDQWGAMSDETWAGFVEKNAESVRLHEPISTPFKHKLLGPEDKQTGDWQSPDLALFLSRVGFNRKKTEAVVYVLMFSYMDQVSTAGDYFLFRLSNTGRWEPNGRVTYFSMDKNGSQQ